MQKIVRDGVETNIQVLDAGEVRVSALHLPSIWQVHCKACQVVLLFEYFSARSTVSS